MRFRCFFLAAVLCISGCLSCDSRDPEVEFQDLSATAFEPREGIEKANEYLNHFRKNPNARIQEVKNICYQYEKMADFDGKSYPDFASLIAEGQELDREFSMSESYGIRNEWSALYKDKRKRTRQFFLDSIDEAQFSTKLNRAARDICSDSYLTWKVERVEETLIGPAELEEDGSAKVCPAEYMVFLRGSIVGIQTYNAKVSTKGRFSFDSNGRLHFTIVDAAIIDGPPDAKDIIDHFLGAEY